MNALRLLVYVALLSAIHTASAQTPEWIWHANGGKAPGNNERRFFRKTFTLDAKPTKAKDKARILSALDNLSAGGSTAGAEGIRQAYNLAEMNFDKLGVTRVILATDGDFNVGITDQNELKSFIERERNTGIFLSVLGFGVGNYNDAMMQTLAQNGNGNAAYIDTLSEARKLLVEEASSTLFPIAKDVKIQVEFNPAQVAAYRLVGYENRLLAKEDFNDDTKDAGEIGAGHTVTVLYEVVPAGVPVRGAVDPLKYQPEKNTAPASEPTVSAPPSVSVAPEATDSAELFEILSAPLVLSPPALTVVAPV